MFCNNLVDLALTRARENPADQAYVHLLDAVTVKSAIDYATLAERAQAIAAVLQRQGAGGERALLLYPPGVEFVEAFLGCLFAGVTAVPANPSRNKNSYERLEAIAADAQASLILGTASLLAIAEKSFAAAAVLDRLPKIATDDIAGGLHAAWTPPAIAADALAYLQYTSGSTAQPKGVMVSHGNVLANLSEIDEALPAVDQPKMVTWLPPFHDMGLILGLLYPLYKGMPAIILAPAAFLQRPALWLEVIGRYRGTISGAPNFAFDLCVDTTTPEQRAHLDLTSLQAVYNGAEPIRAQSLQRFCDAFAPSGLAAAAVCSAYGLAETTLKTTTSGADSPTDVAFFDRSALLAGQVVPVTAGLADAQAVVSCGACAGTTVVKIVDPLTGKPAAADRIGEVWICGPSVAQGYWRRPEESAATFQARIAETGEGPFLRTGDLGFLHRGQLYVTGRSKEVIIIRGLNHYPQDIEKTVQQCHPGLRPNSGAAFSVGIDGEESLVVVQEVERSFLRRMRPESVFAAIRRGIAEEHGLQTHAICLLKPGAVAKTSSGKIQRRKVRQDYLDDALHEIAGWRFQGHAPAAFPPPASAATLAAWIGEWLAQTVGVPVETIRDTEPLASFGLDSRNAVRLSGDLAAHTGRALSPTLVWEYPTIGEIVRHLTEEATASAPAPAAATTATAMPAAEPVAIIGMGCRFPGAADAEALRDLLWSGRSGIGSPPAGREGDRGPDYKRGGWLEGIELFDPGFFGIAPREAACIDPQQRLLLEVCQRALEDAALVPGALAGQPVGVFVGISGSDYGRLAAAATDAPEGYFAAGTALSIAANRISYIFDFRGPSLAVDTACSSSLTAIHQACASLRQGESTLAIAAGVNLILDAKITAALGRAGMLSATGDCKTFDAAADGYVRGEGVGAVVLKPLSAALRNGDPVRAVIRGSAVAQDGASNGLTAPNPQAQRQVVGAALRAAGATPEQIGFIEAHGTGTPLGDPIELEALGVVLGERAAAPPCLIGAIKTNIGHLEAAAGIAGVIKTVLCLETGEIPPNLLFRERNPHIPPNAAFEFPLAVRPWPRSGPRLAGVSSFGFGGVNVHLVLASAAKPKPAEAPDLPVAILALSTKTRAALPLLAAAFRDRLERQPDLSLKDFCYSAHVRRAHYGHRLALAADSVEELRNALDAAARAASPSAAAPPRPAAQPKIAFLFSGQGAQYPGMAAGLYRTHPRFREVLDRCDALLQPHTGRSLVEILLAEGEEGALVHRTEWTQPALFAVEYALAALWRSWGVEPDLLLGHSVGEYVAACLAGVFSLEDALRLIATRGRLMQDLPEGGAMAAVFASAGEVTAKLAPCRDEVAIAAVNGDRHVVISGGAKAVQSLLADFEAEGVRTRRLEVSHAFHSPLMAPVLEPFRQILAATPLAPPRLAVVSNLSGRPAGAEMADAGYWSAHLRDAVRFAEGMKTLAAAGCTVFIEIGPAPVLLGMGARALEDEPGANDFRWLPSLRQAASDGRRITESLAELYVAGASIDWAAFHRPFGGQPIALPGHPFLRSRHWFTEAASSLPPTAAPRPSSPAAPALSGATLREQLREIVARLLRSEPAAVEDRIPFLHMGADSLLLMELTRAVQGAFGVKVSVRQLFEGENHLEALCAFIEPRLSDAPTEIATPAASPPTDPPGESSWENVLRCQAQAAATVQSEIAARTLSEVVTKQLAFLRGRQPASGIDQAGAADDARPLGGGQGGAWDPDPWSRPLTAEQQSFLETFIASYRQRTRRSRQAAEEFRPMLADLRNSMGFRPEIKEILYPIQAVSSAGARFVDVDGNSFLDLTLGFGVHFFGHNPEFVARAIRDQLDLGMQLGPQSPLAGEVAAGIRELTGVERVTFCNSGTEAVMTAIRLARAATGKTRVVLFSVSYHGHSDGTLAVAGPDAETLPMAPGVPPGWLQDVLVLPYGEEGALETIRQEAGRLAAVLVEPVQSRRPDLQPAEFLRRLRELTAATGVPLIFDEIITGFRSHPGGAQAHFGVQADLVTYGKLLGGGLPLGVVAGRAALLDGIDGGAWRYGDDSRPLATKTFAAGTFCRHPLAMAAALAVLNRLRREGPALQQGLNRRTEALARTLNALFDEEQAPLRVVYFGSMFRFVSAGNSSYLFQPLDTDLFFHALIAHGVYIWEGRTCFLCTAHTEADISFIVEAVRKSVRLLRAGGFLQGPAAGEPPAAANLPLTGPLSEAQRQLWSLAQISPEGSLAYGLQLAVRLRGKLEHRVVEDAVRAVVARHEALRTVIDGEGGVWTVRDQVAVAVPLLDLSLCAAEEREERAAQRLGEIRREPFDCAAPPLFRVFFIRMSEEEHLLVFSAHHILVDGWSFGVLIEETGRLCRAALEGSAVQLPPPLPFRRYLDWLAEERRSGALDRQRDWWLARLPKGLSPIDLPLDRPRPPLPGYSAHHQRVAIDGELRAAIVRFGQERGCTLSMTLLGAFAIYLRRLCGAAQAVIGVPAGARSLADAEHLVGNCANLLPIPCPVAPEETVDAVLARLRQLLPDAWQHQDYPLAELIRDLKLNAVQAPPVSVTFNLERRIDPADAFGLSAAIEPDPLRFTAFDLCCNVLEFEGGLLLDWDGRADLFAEATIARFATGFLALLRSLLANPQLPVRLLEVMPAAEKRRLLTDWNATARVLPTTCVHQLFEAQAAATPDATAVLFAGDRRIDYAQLNGRANQLAHRLLALGARPDAPVAIALERSPELIVALLAVLKAGAAYLPLDPSYPDERLAFMLEDSQARILLTQSHLPDRLPRIAEHVLCLDDWSALAEVPEHNPQRPVAPGHLAYIIYTSGSTGRPKGVMIEHRGLSNYLLWAIEAYGPAAAEASPVHSSISFDLTVTSIYPPLLSGGYVELLPEDIGGEALLAALREKRRRSLVKITPAHLELLGRQLGPDELAGGSKTLVIGGENLLAETLAPWRRHAPSTRLINEYGPTETVVGCCVYEARPEDPHSGAVPIGRPIANTRLYVLDHDLQPTPIGVPGELHIGGAGLARGYWNRPELTAEKFIADPFSDRPGDRLYKTGDLARYRPDGNLECLGRLDQQVKIRGFRIELGEIEAALASHPRIGEAVVIAREDAGPLSLAAYLVPAAAAAVPPVAELRAFLQKTLPDYMLPAAFVVLEALPLTANGKVDRRALPAPEQDGTATAPPRTPLEEILAGLWGQVLQQSSPGIHDNFFALGGHSLLATQLTARLRDALAITVPVRWLFETPTIAELAPRIGALERFSPAPAPENRIPAAAVRITPDMLPLAVLPQSAIDRIAATVDGGAPNIQDIYPLTPPQAGILFHHRLHSTGDPYLSHALLAFDSRPRCDAFVAALQAVVDRHDILRSAVVWEELSEPMQVVWRRAALPVEIQHFAPAAGPVAEQLRDYLHPRHTRLDLSRAPLLRLVLAQDGERWLLLFLSHHLIMDHTTLDLVLDEIAARLRGDGQPLPPPTPFRNFVAQARGGAPAEEHAAFFRAMLGDIDTPTAPFDLHDVRGDGAASVEAHRALPADLAPRLRRQARRAGATPAALFHLAWALVLSRCCGQDAAVFGTVLFGRLQGGEGVEGALGMFINTLPLRVDCDGRPVAEALRETQQRLLALLRHEHASLGLAQRCSGIPAPAPLFSTLFNYRHGHASQAGARLEGIELLRLDERSNYPICLSVDDLGEDFALTAQVDAAVDPERLCAFMCQALESLVAALEAAPDTPLCALEVLPPAEKRCLLSEWNATDGTPLPQEGLHRRFEAQAAKTPQATAVILQQEALAYGELNARANRLAHQLIALGVGPDAPVAIALERSFAMIVALLAVLKAGGAYVPLDPAYPAERLTFMLEDSGARILLTQEDLVQRLPRTAEHTLRLDGDGAGDAGQPTTNPERNVAPEHLAYIIYTSGSTGQPKGVAIEHRNAAAFLAWGRSVWSPAELAGVLAGTSICFDLSIFEIFLPLSVGGAVILAETVLKLPELAAREQVTLVNTVPSAIDALLRQRALPASVRVVNLAGEPLTTELADRVYAVATVGKVYDLYGPSEDTTYSTCKLRRLGEPPSIGRPIGNTQAYILDHRGRPTPAGVPGELHLGGAGLARGYLGRPELTAERFIADPFSAQPDARLYKTGDLARYRPDGDIEFLGRLDHQVKIRGFRIEPGEIEAALCHHPQVREAVVGPREDVAGRHLVAWLVAAGEPAPAAAQLRSFLQATLPDYMIPAVFVFLPVLPLNANGKIDRKALPAPDAGEGAAQGDAPRNAVEEIVAGIWASLLGREVGIFDNFFELGGHSLLATQVASRLRDAFAAEIPLRRLFDAPTVAALAEEVRACAGQGDDDLPPLLPGPRAGDLPLSFAQQRLWFIDQFDKGSAAYNMTGALRLGGALDAPALDRALAAVVRRHETLRTLIRSAEGEAEQIVTDAPFAGMVRRDLSAYPAPEREAALRALLAAEGRKPFDLASQPPLRALLVRLGAQEHVLLATLHHIAADGWSVGLLIQELAALYGAFAQGRPSPLPPLPVQYADFARWQRHCLGGAALEDQLAYWRTALQGAPELLELPGDRSRPPQQTFRGGVARFRIGEALTQSLRQLGREHGATLFMTLLSAYAVLLGRLGGADDIVVGSPVANRNRRETEELIGFFVNTLPLRVDLSGDPDFVELLRRTRGACLEAYAHQDIPFEHLVEELAPARDLAHAPLFQVVFALQNAAAQEVEFPGLTTEFLEVETGTAKFDLTLAMEERGGELAGALEYNADLFDPASAARMARQLQMLLAGLVADPRQPVTLLPLMEAAEKERLLSGWNATAAAIPDSDVAALFLETAARFPERPALLAPEGELSYQQLADRAQRLAAALIVRGLLPGDIVGIHMERGPEAVTALLGILLAGGVYLPFDEAWPEERRRFVVADARPRLCIVDGGDELAELVPSVRFDALDAPAATPVTVDADAPAYVMYTSGSTGRPKGVLVPHRGIVRLVRNAGAQELAPRDRLLQTGSLAFDASTLEIWCALLNGAALHVPAREALLEPGGIGRLLAEHGITAMFLTTGLFNRCIDDDPAMFRGLRRVWTGGESASPSHMARLLDACPDLELYNAYGPTENSTFTTTHRVRRQDAAGPIPLGRPIANTRVHVIDRRDNLVPVGVPGEICTAGAGLALGYLNRPELTARTFTPLPAAGEALVYRTGDVGRWRADGALEFLGRTDDQVKIRGFRIEPGEIEAALLRLPDVREAVVMAREESPGDRRLAAWIVPAAEAPTVETLRAGLRAALPDYMIPADFVFLAAFPLTSSAKIDRRALPAPCRRTAEEQHAPPQTERQRILATVWQETLGWENIGIHDNFFTVGGDSIKAIQVAARLNRLGLKAEIRDIFRSPTIAELAECLSAAAPMVDQGPVSGPVPLTAVQKLFFQRADTGREHFNQSVLLKTAQPLAAETLASALRALVDHHDALRMTFRAAGGQMEQANAPAGQPVALEILDLQGVAAPESALLERAEALQRSIDLEQGPLLKAVLFRLADGDRLLLVIHHLVIDGVSWRILLEDLSAAIAALETGAPVALPPRTASFRDWSLSLREYCRSGALAGEIAWWRSLLQAPAGELRPDLPGYGPGVHGESRTVTFELDQERTRSLLGPVHEAYRTEINDLLLTALALALEQQHGQRASRIALEGHGREPLGDAPDVARTVGWFTSIYPVRLELPENPDPGYRLRAIKEELRAIPHKGIGFGLLTQICPDEGLPGLEATADLPVSFNYLGQFDQDFAGGRWSPAAENAGAEIAPAMRRSHEIDILAVVTAGVLRFSLTHSPRRFSVAAMEKLAGDYRQALEMLVDHCLQSAGGLTPHDIDYDGLDQDGLDAILDNLSA